MNVAIESRPPGMTRVIDTGRGQAAMVLFIASEAMLFVILFFCYFYLQHGSPNWVVVPPKLTLALAMLAVLLSSSVVLHWGEGRLDRGQPGTAKAAVAGTILLGLGFLAIQSYEFSARLKEISPRQDAYGSLFFTITSVHAAHVVLGLLMLAYVLILPDIGSNDRPPHRPLHNVGLYWHFVDAAWIVIVTLLYLLPSVRS